MALSLTYNNYNPFTEIDQIYKYTLFRTNTFLFKMKEQLKAFRSREVSEFIVIKNTVVSVNKAPTG